MSRPANETVRRNRIAIFGSAGIPNRYGGPEAFAESIAPVLVARGYSVTVTCDRSRYPDRAGDPDSFRGVRRRFVGVGANGASSILHDLIAFLLVVRNHDYILALGVSGGMFFPLFRVLCALTGARLLVNIDGVEWRREKFGAVAKSVLFISDYLAQRFAHVIIYDNEALLGYVRHPRKAACVEYIGDQALRAYAQSPVSEVPAYALTICRIEPENNCEAIIEGFLRSSMARYVFVGNWERSEYGRALRRRYKDQRRLELVDAIYDSEKIFELRRGCAAYLHGHSVGGTNPSLVEILYFDCQIFCFDCSFNRATAGAAVHYFSDADELGRLIDCERGSIPDRSGIRERYSTAAIVQRLLAALDVHP
jgi:glycosyltransferase involved in cell wall biosynthesis